MVGKQYTGTTFTILLTATFLACLSSYVSAAVAIGPRGYKKLNDSGDEKDEARPGDLIVEIAAADLLARAQKGSRPVVATVRHDRFRKEPGDRAAAIKYDCGERLDNQTAPDKNGFGSVFPNFPMVS